MIYVDKIGRTVRYGVTYHDDRVSRISAACAACVALATAAHPEMMAGEPVRCYHLAVAGRTGRVVP
jgi:hypothetical protein